MSTRSNVIVQDEEERIQIYRHGDGYPEAVIPDLAKALEYAWELPRFEAADFAAALIRAWKQAGGGNIYIDGTPRAFEMIHGDTEWVYVIEQDKKTKELVVKIYDWHHHWFNRSNITDPQFKPRCKKIIPLKDGGERG